MQRHTASDQAGVAALGHDATPLAAHHSTTAATSPVSTGRTTSGVRPRHRPGPVDGVPAVTSGSSTALSRPTMRRIAPSSAAFTPRSRPDGPGRGVDARPSGRRRRRSPGARTSAAGQSSARAMSHTRSQPAARPRRIASSTSAAARPRPPGSRLGHHRLDRRRGAVDPELRAGHRHAVGAEDGEVDDPEWASANDSRRRRSSTASSPMPWDVPPHVGRHRPSSPRSSPARPGRAGGDASRVGAEHQTGPPRPSHPRPSGGCRSNTARGRLRPPSRRSASARTSRRRPRPCSHSELCSYDDGTRVEGGDAAGHRHHRRRPALGQAPVEDRARAARSPGRAGRRAAEATVGAGRYGTTLVTAETGSRPYRCGKVIDAGSLGTPRLPPHRRHEAVGVDHQQQQSSRPANSRSAGRCTCSGDDRWTKPSTRSDGVATEPGRQRHPPLAGW